MMRGVYCFDCLYMRQGEHGEEVAELGDAWRCPSCRDICNCSFCRTKKGFPPTGSMYRSALAMGFDSVAHYLVLSNQEDEASREAAMKEADNSAARLTADERAEHVGAMNEAADGNALKAAFSAAWMHGATAKDSAAQQEFKTAYDQRKGALGVA